MLREQLEFLAERDTEDERTKKAQQRVLALKRLEADRKEVEEQINQVASSTEMRPLHALLTALPYYHVIR